MQSLASLPVVLDSLLHPSESKGWWPQQGEGTTPAKVPPSSRYVKKGLGWRAVGAAPSKESSREHMVWMLRLSWEDSLGASMEWRRSLRTC